MERTLRGGERRAKGRRQGMNSTISALTNQAIRMLCTVPHPLLPPPLTMAVVVGQKEEKKGKKEKREQKEKKMRIEGEEEEKKKKKEKEVGGKRKGPKNRQEWKVNKQKKQKKREKRGKRERKDKGKEKLEKNKRKGVATPSMTSRKTASWIQPKRPSPGSSASDTTVLPAAQA